MDRGRYRLILSRIEKIISQNGFEKSLNLEIYDIEYYSSLTENYYIDKNNSIHLVLVNIFMRKIIQVNNASHCSW